MSHLPAKYLLHAALRFVLGGHVKQAGSLVASERLRFDFTHFAPLTAAEIEKIEDIVNEQVWRDTTVRTTIMDLESAMQSGAMALFGEKYQEHVRVVEIPGYSKELCGGTHVRATGMIGLFKIVAEGGIAAGIRRLEALTGQASLDRFRADERVFEDIQVQHKISSRELPSILDKWHKEIRDLQRQAEDLKLAGARSNIALLVSKAHDYRGVKIVAHATPALDRGGMRAFADELKQKLGSGVVILGTAQDGKVSLVVMVTDDLSKELPAGKIIKEIAPLVGGSGGGKPELAEAGGKDPSKLADAIDKSYSIVEMMLGRRG